MNYKTSLSVDKDTNEQDNYHGEGDFQITLFNRAGTTIDEQRIQVFDKIEFKDNKINFVESIPRVTGKSEVFAIDKPITDDLLVHLSQKALESWESGAGLFKGPFEKDKFYALPAAGPFKKEDFQFYVDPPKAVRVFWHEEKQQYIAILSGTAKDITSIRIAYEYKFNHDYEISPSLSSGKIREPKEPEEHLLPEDLRKRIESTLNGKGKDKQALQFLFSETLSKEEKLGQLIDHFAHRFSQEDLTANPKADIDVLLAEILEKKGVCRHVSQTFMLLAHFLDIPVRINENERHSFCEISYQTSKGIVIHKINLGGGIAYDFTPQEKRENVFEKAAEKTNAEVELKSAADIRKNYLPAVKAILAEKFAALRKTQENRKKIVRPSEAQSTATQTMNPLTQIYRKIIRDFMSEKIIATPADLLKLNNDGGRVPLIVLKDQQHVWDVTGKIADQMRLENKPPFLYIDKPQDFLMYWMPLALINGDYQRIDGPLKEMNQKGRGTVIINWCNFTAEELASLKSVMDRPPTLFGNPLNQGIQFIGLADQSIQSCSAFKTRAKQYPLSDTFMSTEVKGSVKKVASKVASKKEEEGEEEEIETVEINLFNSPAWRVALYGDETLTNNILTMIEGPLIRAIRLNLPIVILNPPDDPNFHLLMHRIRHEKRIFYNDKFIDVPENFSIKTEPKENAIQDEKDKTQHIHFHAEDPQNRTRIYLSMSNLLEALQQMQVSNGNRIPTDGLLRSYNQKSQIFYITESLPRAAWEMLFDYMRNPKHGLSDKHFDFMLAPGVQIEDLPVTSAPLAKASKLTPFDALPMDANVFTSDDPDFVSTQLKATIQKTLSKDAEPPLIIDITPNMTFADIMYEMKKHQIEIDDPNKKDGRQDQRDQKDQKDKITQTRFEFIQKDGLKALANGRHVILNGPLTATLYQQLLPVLNREEKLHVNGAEIPMTGKLYVVQPAHVRKLYALQNDVQKDFATFDNYKKLFLYDKKLLNKAYTQDDIERLHNFYNLVQLLPAGGVGRPDKPRFTHQRILKMLQAIHTQKSHQGENPIKGLFHYDYPRYSEDYAYLNVIAKHTFKKDVPEKENILAGFRKNKLSQLNKHYDLLSTFTLEKFKQHSWSVLNCFNAELLHAYFGDDITKYMNANAATSSIKTFPQLNDQELQRLYDFSKAALDGNRTQMLNALNVHRSTKDTKTTVLEMDSHIVKQENKVSKQFRTLLANPLAKLIILKGEAGVGKTSLVKAEIPNHYLGTEKGIIQCLNDKSDATKYILLDEGNIFPEGTWNFFKAIFRGDKQVYFNGKVYDTPNIKIVSTVNPEDYPNREYQSFFQDHGDVIYVNKPSDDFLTQKILQPALQAKFPHDFAEIKEGMLAAYHLIKKYDRYFPDSIREMEDLAQRFMTVVEMKRGTDEEDLGTALKIACDTQFAGSIKDKNFRNEYIQELGTHFHVKTNLNSNLNSTVQKQNDPRNRVIELTEQYALPQEKSYILEAIQQNLATRDRHIKAWEEQKVKKDNKDSRETQPFYFKPAMLLEGESGIGKSKIYKVALEEGLRKELELLKTRGLDPNSDGYKQAYADIEKKWSYLEMTSGSITEETRQELRQAFHDGKFVIFDEFNLSDPEIEQDIACYVTGEDRDGNKATKPGFNIFLSQNFTLDAGRKSLASSIRSRTHFLYMDPYEEKELVSLADHFLLHGKEFVSSVQDFAKEHPEFGMRTFFYLMEYMTKELSIYLKPDVDEKKSAYSSKKGFSLFGNRSDSARLAAEGLKLYEAFRSEIKSTTTEDQSEEVLKKYAPHKEKIFAHLQEINNPIQKLKLLDEALNKHSELGQLFWKKRGAFTPDLKSGTLQQIKSEYDGMVSKISEKMSTKVTR